MTFEAFIARRYLSAKNKTLFVSLLSFISLLGMATSVFALIFVLAVMSGFETDFQKRVIGFKAPLMVTGPLHENWETLGAELQKVDPHITAIHSFVEGEVIVQTGSGDATGARLRGVTGAITSERFGEVALSEPMDRRNVILGRELANNLRLDPDFFEKIRLVFPFGEMSPSGDLLPVTRFYTVGGTFRSGYYDYDSKYLLVLYPEALRLLGDYGRAGLEVWIQPISAVEKVKKHLLGKVVPPLQVETWKEQNPKLFAALKLERIGMFLLLVVLLLIASCTIFGLISLTVIEKIGETAILRSCGLSRGRVRKIFLIKAASIGLMGDVAGGLVGLGLVSYLVRHPFRLPSTYYVEYLPLHIDCGTIVLVLLLSPLLAIAAALYPAWQSATQSPAELLRYE